MKQILLILAFVYCLSSCTALPTAPMGPPAPVPEPARGWRWNDYVAAHLTPAMLATDPGKLCPNFQRVDHVQFWQTLLYATVDAESGGNSNDDYIEKFADSSGKRQVSSGLLQISLDDVKRGGNCAGLSAANIHDPQTNLKCGLEIMAQIVGSRSSMQASLGRYWSSIRDNWNATRKEDLTKTMSRVLPGCF